MNGGFRFCAKADAPDRPNYRIKEHGWTFIGDVNSLRAYSRRNQVLCTLPPGDLPFLNKWWLLMGGKTKTDLHAIADEIGVTANG